MGYLTKIRCGCFSVVTVGVVSLAAAQPEEADPYASAWSGFAPSSWVIYDVLQPADDWERRVNRDDFDERDKWVLIQHVGQNEIDEPFTEGLRYTWQGRSFDQKHPSDFDYWAATPEADGMVIESTQPEVRSIAGQHVACVKQTYRRPGGGDILTLWVTSEIKGLQAIDFIPASSSAEIQSQHLRLPQGTVAFEYQSPIPPDLKYEHRGELLRFEKFKVNRKSLRCMVFEQSHRMNDEVHWWVETDWRTPEIPGGVALRTWERPRGQLNGVRVTKAFRAK